MSICRFPILIHRIYFPHAIRRCFTENISRQELLVSRMRKGMQHFISYSVRSKSLSSLAFSLSVRFYLYAGNKEIQRTSISLPYFYAYIFQIGESKRRKSGTRKKKKKNLNSACPGQERGVVRINFSSLAAFLLSPE